jgi:hypothetical protein
MNFIKAKLIVNSKEIQMDKFTQSFVSHVAGGILSALKAPENITQATISIDSNEVDIIVNTINIPLNPFVNDFVRNTITGTVSSLRGVESPIRTLQLDLS